MKDLHIDGIWADAAAGTHSDVLNPATGQVIEQVAEAGREEVDAAVKAARRAFDDGPWRQTTATISRLLGFLLQPAGVSFG